MSYFMVLTPQASQRSVERNMSTLSHDIAGVILPHDAYGSHLDATGKTVDSDLGKTFSRRRKFWPKFGRSQWSTDMQLIVKQCVPTRSLFQLKSRPCGYHRTSNNAGMLSKWSNSLMMNAANRLKQIGCQCSLPGLCHFLLCTNTEWRASMLSSQRSILEIGSSRSLL